MVRVWFICFLMHMQIQQWKYTIRPALYCIKQNSASNWFIVENLWNRNEQPSSVDQGGDILDLPDQSLFILQSNDSKTSMKKRACFQTRSKLLTWQQEG